MFYTAPAVQAAPSYEESECYLGTTPYYDARVQSDPGAYDVFVKIGKRGQTATTALYVESSSATDCQAIGATTANGDNWQKVGTWTSANTDPVRFQLASDSFTVQADANRPSIMLVPQVNPPCKPAVNCDFIYQNNPAYILPTGTLLSEDTLHVLQVRPIEGDTLEKVDYYSDGQLLYSKPTLEEFDLRYVPGGDHTLSRVLVYKSGQKVVLPAPVYVSFAQDFQNLLFRIFNGNKVGLQIVAVLTIVGIMVLIALWVVHAIHRRRVWKLSHGLVKEEIVHPISNLPTDYVPTPHFTPEDTRLTKNIRRYTPIAIMAVSVLVIIGLTDSYLAQLFRVDGVSMETTLQTDDQLFVNKIPKTWASLNRQEYIPKRGEVVVFHKAHSEQFLKENEDEKNVYVVKRVLALPGERVVIKDGVVTVFNRGNPQGFNPDQNSSWEKTLTLDTSQNLDVTLGKSEIFASGDNRPESIDSRANGPIDVSELVGRAEARVVPFGKRRTL